MRQTAEYREFIFRDGEGGRPLPMSNIFCSRAPSAQWLQFTVHWDTPTPPYTPGGIQGGFSTD